MAASNNNPPRDFHRMIATFRVLELKQYLRSLNVPASGRKSELQARALKVLETGNPKAREVLDDLHERTFPSSPVSKVKNPPKPPVSHSTANPPSFHVKHPDVKLKSHPFYQHVDTVHRPTALESSSYMKKAMTVQFHLTPQHIRHIFESETTPGNYQTQVILRFCKKETSYEQEDFYPGNCYITINSQPCTIPGYNPNYSMRPEYKRAGKPINITSYIHTSPAIVNTMSITWNHDIIHTQGFCFAIDLMKLLSSADLLQKLKAKQTRSASVSQVMIKDKLSMDRDSEISTTSLRLSLICPLGKIRISNPCKSTACDHLQCFDASIYLQMNERKAKWICPVCDRPAPFADLLIDGYLLEICGKSFEDLIEFDADGSWHPIKKSTKDNKVVSLTPPTSITIHDSPLAKSTLGSFKGDVIDLTTDSEEENDCDIVRPSSTSSCHGVNEASSLTSVTNESVTLLHNNIITTTTTSTTAALNSFTSQPRSSTALTQSHSCSTQNETTSIFHPPSFSFSFTSDNGTCSRSSTVQNGSRSTGNENGTISSSSFAFSFPSITNTSLYNRLSVTTSTQSSASNMHSNSLTQSHSRSISAHKTPVISNGRCDDNQSLNVSHDVNRSQSTRVPVISRRSSDDPLKLIVKIPLSVIASPMLSKLSVASSNLFQKSTTSLLFANIANQHSNNIDSSESENEALIPSNNWGQPNVNLFSRQKHRRKGHPNVRYLPYDSSKGSYLSGVSRTGGLSPESFPF